jgi:hypothetical protein
VSLDKGASSDPNLKAVHAGASMRKAQHLQPKASDSADAEVGCFAFSRLAAHIRVLSKSGEKPTFSKTIILLKLFHGSAQQQPDAAEGNVQATGHLRRAD